MIFFDAHVHLYPGYNQDVLFDSYMRHARRVAPAAQQHAMAIMLREGQGSLSELCHTTAQPGQRWHYVNGPTGDVLSVSDGKAKIYLFAARQVATAERIELLGLFSEAAIPDGLPALETLAQLQAGRALPLLAWGLGKWLLGRAPVVDSLLAAADPANFLIADSALRPTFWGEPRPMRRARQRGIRVICGSDPLPHPGDETVAGRYATLIEGLFEGANAAGSLRQLLLDRATGISAIGRRQGLAGTIWRLRPPALQL